MQLFIKRFLLLHSDSVSAGITVILLAVNPIPAAAVIVFAVVGPISAVAAATSLNSAFSVDVLASLLLFFAGVNAMLL